MVMGRIGLSLASRLLNRSARNIVWGAGDGDNIVRGTSDDNIVWGTSDDNIVWGTGVLGGERD
jgi:hypothetical protein